jgi:hypothetical protein
MSFWEKLEDDDDDDADASEVAWLPVVADLSSGVLSMSSTTWSSRFGK